MPNGHDNNQPSEISEDGRRLRKRLRQAGTRAELFPLVTNGLLDFFEADVCAVFTREGKGEVDVALTTRKSGKFRQLTLPLANDNTVGKTLETGRVLNYPAASAEDLAGIPLLESYAGQPLLAVPLKTDGVVTGATVVIKNAAAGGFSPEDESICRSFAEDIAVALAEIAARESSSAEFERLLWQNKQLRRVINAAPELIAAEDVATPLQRLLEEIEKGVAFERGAVYYYDSAQDVVRQIAARGYSAEEAQLAAETVRETLAYRVLRTGKPFHVSDAAAQTDTRISGEARSGSLLAVPIAAGEKIVGAVSLAHERRNAFEPEDVAFVKSLAAYAGVAVETARHLETEKKRALQLSLINAIGKRALRATSTQELYSEIATALKNKFNYYNVAVYSVDTRRGELFLETIVGGYADHLPVGYRQRLGEGLLGVAATQKRPVLVNDVSKEERFRDATPATMETKSELCVPILCRGEVAAVLDLQSLRTDAFEESDALVLETLADQIGVTLENTALLREERQRTNELALVGEIGKEILAAHDLPGLLRTTAVAIRKHFKYFNVAVFLVDAEQPRTLTASVVEGAYERALRKSPTIPFGQGLVGWCGEKGEVAFTNDATQDPRYAADPIPGEARSEVAIPIKIGDHVVGVLDVQENARDALTNQDVEILRTFAGQLAVAIHNVQLLGKAQRSTQEAETLLHISHIISQTVDLDKSLEFLTEETTTVMDADAAALILLDREEKPRILKSAAGLPEPIEKALRSGEFDLGPAALFARAANSSKPVFVAGDQVGEGDPSLAEFLPHFNTQAAVVAPLRKTERLLGYLLAVWEARSPAVSESELSLFEGIAFQAAIGVENLLYLENVRRQTDYLSIISSIAAEASRLPPLEELLSNGLHKITAFAGLAGGAIHLYDAKRHRLSLTASVGVEDRSKETWEALVTIDEARTAPLLSQRIFVVESEEDDDPFGLPPAAEGGPTGYLSVPLVALKEVLGRLTLFSWHAAKFKVEDTELLRTICDQISVFIENMQLFSQNASRMEELVTLLETSKTVSSSLDTEEIIYDIAQKVKDLIGADECTVFLLDRDAGVLEPIVSLTAYPEEVMKIRLKLGEGITGHVALTGLGEYVNDARADQRSMVVPGTPSEDRESLLCVPLVSREETIGVMTLGRLGGDIFTDRDLQLLTLFAGQVAGSIENARLFDRVLSSMSIAEEHRRKLDATFASITDAIIVTDPGLRVIEVNPAAEKMLGREARDVANRHVRSIIETPTLHETFEHAMRLLREQEVAEFEFAVNPRGAEGPVSYYRVLVNAVTSPAGEKVGYVATFRDVTEAKELAFLKENFIANVSHELRTPLTSIIGSSELIMADGDAAQYPYFQFVSIIDKEARRLRELVDSILDFSLLESRELELRLEPVDASELAEGTVETYRDMARDNEIYLEYEPGEGIPITYADPNLLVSALGNLIKNAVQFNAAGGNVRVSTRLADGEITFAVADDGPGIPDDQLESIFSTFYQVDSSTTRAVGGTGLGLAIAKRAVESHGGRIIVSSAVGEGSTFQLVIPIREEYPADKR
ncbi:MAG: GAF domain-containing protein [Candidatus Coatesbacteria bacterium]|nr:MAG: GAF domain-containing protein [Candidatus Coatesbacteria bacterium]